MVPCQMYAAGLFAQPSGAPWIVSASEPKPLASTIVRDDEAALVSAAKAATPPRLKNW
jgi:hypothetical protein